MYLKKSLMISRKSYKAHTALGLHSLTVIIKLSIQTFWKKIKKNNFKYWKYLIKDEEVISAK